MQRDACMISFTQIQRVVGLPTLLSVAGGRRKVSCRQRARTASGDSQAATFASVTALRHLPETAARRRPLRSASKSRRAATGHLLKWSI